MEPRVDGSTLDQLTAELIAYSEGQPPFCPAYMPSAAMSVRAWWLSILNNSTATVIVSLAVLLYGIVPHAAANERTFSIMKWLNAPRRSSQSVATLKRLTRVRTSLSSIVPRPRQVLPFDMRFCCHLCLNDLMWAAVTGLQLFCPQNALLSRHPMFPKPIRDSSCFCGV